MILYEKNNMIVYIIFNIIYFSDKINALYEEEIARRQMVLKHAEDQLQDVSNAKQLQNIQEAEKVERAQQADNIQNVSEVDNAGSRMPPPQYPTVCDETLKNKEALDSGKFLKLYSLKFIYLFIRKFLYILCCK